MVKVIDGIHEAISNNRRFFAFEFFPPKTEAGVTNLYDRVERMAASGPLFTSITWGDGGTTAKESIEIAATAQQVLGINMQLNITGYGATEAEMRQWLDAAKTRGVHNLCLLRGDPVNVAHQKRRPSNDAGGDASPTAEEQPFKHAVDLIRFVRSNYGDYFGIAVAGYPEGHGECPDQQLGIQHLKEKVDAGADVVISQMIYDAQTFLRFCADCREAGITCPIIPGIMPVHSYQNFRRCMAHTSNGDATLRAGTEPMEQALHAVRNDDAEVRRVGLGFTVQLVKQLFRAGVRGIYIFTMNLESVVSRLLEELSLVEEVGRREMPWKPAADAERRSKEEVRPIHWATRPKSYLALTAHWDEFPNGRWGATQSPAYREDTTYHGTSDHTALALTSRERHCHSFAGVAKIADVCDVFLAFLNGHGRLPWSDELTAEVDFIMTRILVPLNSRGLLTINSQPPVNGAKSTNHIVGWGPAGGYVYQKQYLEFFCSREAMSTVLQAFDRYPSLTYLATDAAGKVVQTNCDADQAVTAVTWGVFPGREVKQPTISSLEAFQAWAPEAFSLWSAPFSFGQGEVPPVILEIQKEWVLINVVDNEFIARPTPLDNAIASVVANLPPLTDSTSSNNQSPATSAPTVSVGSAFLEKPQGGGDSRRQTVKRYTSSSNMEDLLELGFVVSQDAQPSEHQRTRST